MNKKQGLNFLNIAFLYVGSIMGAGFASGRELWQFFGVFGSKGFIGIAIVAVLFILVGVISAMVAIKINNSDMGRVVVPGGNSRLASCIGIFLAIIMYTVIITMSAAGGAVFAQQFGLSRALGGAIIVAMVIATVIGGFDRVAGVFRFMMPVLSIVVVVASLLIIFSDLPKLGDPSIEIKAAPMIGRWYLSPMVYMSYNLIVVIPIIAKAALEAKSETHAVVGAGLGGLILVILALILVIAMNTDPAFSHAADMPMLAYTKLFGKGINVLYTCVLFFAIYAAATSNFYGFTTKLADNESKNMKIIVTAIIGFAFGLLGFKEIVAYMLPMEGYFGLLIIAMLIINFWKTVVKGEVTVNEKLSGQDN